jgi:hydroxymethylpyrimidine pyrophosphatase-like HAD family hydrolase
MAAVDHVRRSLGLAPEEIAVFGDDLNDLEMITHFPVSVAMENGVPEVRAAARHVTLSNDEGGVAHALRCVLHITD